MNPDNLIFSSKIDSQVEDICFDIILNELQDFYGEIYVQNVAIAPNEIIFFVKIDDGESIIRVPIQND